MLVFWLSPPGSWWPASYGLVGANIIRNKIMTEEEATRSFNRLFDMVHLLVKELNENLYNSSLSEVKELLRTGCNIEEVNIATEKLEKEVEKFVTNSRNENIENLKKAME